jgi:Cu/Ag efflux protein CusF
MKTLAIIAATALAFAAVAQDKKPAPAPAPKGAAAAEVAKVVATVESVDQTTRAVTLKGPKGDMVSFIAGPDVKNLAQVQKGDQVTIEYIAAVAATIKKASGQTRERIETEFKKGAPLGQKPAGIMGKDVKIVASVEAIDAKNNMVTLRGPQRTVTLKVKDNSMLKDVKVGDFVEAEYIEAVAVKVEKAPAAAKK